MLDLLPRQQHRVQGRKDVRYQDEPLQGLRNLRQGLPKEGHHNEGGVILAHDIAINGDNAVALAWKQIDPDVCAAYPITPQTSIVAKIADYVANGEVTTEFVCVESEHSALTLCTASESAGASTLN